MENATKGLIIAGSVLIAIMIIGMLMFFFNRLKEYPKEQEAEIAKEQTAKFNAEWESYIKTKMYGTDVVTVINKAIDNNKKYVAKNTKENFYYIDVEVRLLSTTTIESYRKDYVNGEETGTFYTGTVTDKNPNGIKYTLGSKLSGTFSLSKNASNIEDVVTWESKKIKTTNTFDDKNYTIVYSGFTDFKRKYFKYTGAEYDKTTGRLNKLCFEEIRLQNP